MDIGVEISLYPLQADYAAAIHDFIGRLQADARLRVDTNSVSTQVYGAYEDVMAALGRELRPTFAAAADAGRRAVFVLKVLGPLAPA